MGGITSALGEMAERGLQKTTSAFESNKAGRGVLNLFGNQEWELDLSPEGRAIKGMQNEYIRLHAQALDRENAKLQAVKDWHSSDKNLRNSLPIKNTRMAQYHAAAVASGSPVRNITQSILDADPENRNLTMQQLMIKNQSIARLKALSGSYGDNFENAAPLIARLRRSGDPRSVLHGQRLADIISNQVRDTRLSYGHTGILSDQSAAKISMNKAFVASNKLYETLEEPQVKLLNTNPTYDKPEEIERKAHRILDTIMLPTLAIKHVGQFFNLPASSPLPAIGAALLRMNHDEMEKTVEASGIVSSTLWNAMYRDILGETGRVSEWTHSPEVGKILARTIHQPGFTWLRRVQLNMAGSVGFHSAIYWAHNFAESGSKIAEARLREMEISPVDVIKQGGKLTEEQLQKGVFHYVNNRMFFAKGIDNSLWQNKNVFARAGFMYHSFVNSQVAFMKREVLLMAKAGDIKGLAQFAGTMAVLFPNIAPLIGGAEKLLTTGSIQQAQDQTKQGYQRLYHPSSIPDWLSNYVELISHIGAAGVYFNYLNALKGHRLADALEGPFAGAIVTDAYDTYTAATGGNTAPLKRDILKQTIPVLGSPLAHTLYPTKNEEGGGRGGSRSRFRIRGGRRR